MTKDALQLHDVIKRVASQRSQHQYDLYFREPITDTSGVTYHGEDVRITASFHSCLIPDLTYVGRAFLYPGVLKHVQKYGFESALGIRITLRIEQLPEGVPPISKVYFPVKHFKLPGLFGGVHDLDIASGWAEKFFSKGV